MRWQVHAASATGKSHLDKDIPCQDAFAYRVDGERLVAAVCDGAGSAAHSEIGSRLIADAVVATLGERLAAQPHWLQADEDAFAGFAGEAVGLAREALVARAGRDGAALSSYAATLVAFVGDAQRGWFVHIGDGLGVAEPVQADAPARISLPHNGEYANETYFVTGEAWRACLRVLAVDQPVQRVALMSDGAMPFAMQKGNAGLYRPFMEPVERYLRTVDEAAGSRALHGTLDDPRTHGITSDDKTLLIALRA